MPLANELGIELAQIRDPAFTQMLAGNLVLEGMDPHATVYGGHQFGHWAGQLGDGRAINLGELVVPSDDLVMLQLKGAGATPFCLQ